MRRRRAIGPDVVPERSAPARARAPSVGSSRPKAQSCSIGTGSCGSLGGVPGSVNRAIAPSRYRAPVRRGLLLDRHRRVRGTCGQRRQDELLASRRAQLDADAGRGRGLRRGTGPVATTTGGSLPPRRAVVRTPRDPVAVDDDLVRRRHGSRRWRRRPASRPGSSPAFEAAVAYPTLSRFGSSQPSRARYRAPRTSGDSHGHRDAGLVAGEQLDVGQAPLALALDEAARALDGRIGQRAEEVAAVVQAEVPAIEAGARGERLEQVDPLARRARSPPALSNWRRKAPVETGVVSVASAARRSSTTTLSPARAAKKAVAQPMTPPPMIATSAVAGGASAKRTVGAAPIARV